MKKATLVILLIITALLCSCNSFAPKANTESSSSAPEAIDDLLSYYDFKTISDPVAINEGDVPEGTIARCLGARKLNVIPVKVIIDGDSGEYPLCYDNYTHIVYYCLNFTLYSSENGNFCRYNPDTGTIEEIN